MGTACMAFTNGEISHFGYNAADGDYGHVVITKHILDGTAIWALYGHLDSASGNPRRNEIRRNSRKVDFVLVL